MYQEAKIMNVFGRTAMSSESFNMIALLSASIIIKECELWEPDADYSNPPQKGALGYLYENVNWATHGMINALQFHVEIIYAFQEAMLENTNDSVYLHGFDEAQFIARSLDTYQEWKEAVCERQRQKFGKHYGSESAFFITTWNKNNKRFLDMLRPK